MSIELQILQAGPALTIQDNGRPGFSRFGLSAGGAMDKYALAEGAALLGNEANCGVIEMAGFGGSFSLTENSRWIALTGAAMKAQLDGIEIDWRQSFELFAGQILTIGSTLPGVSAGTYGYLHIAGGIDISKEINSVGTHLRGCVGGIDGKALAAGQQLRLLDIAAHPPQAKKLPSPSYLQQRTVRIMWSPQSHLFHEHTRQRLLNETFSLSLRRDRMAMRLDLTQDQPPFEALLSGLSDPVQDGDIQITGDGVPAILVREHQPTGGYPRIATVISADHGAVAQLPSGQTFTFELVARELAIDALRGYRQSIDALANAATPLIRPPEDIANLLDYNLIDGVVSADE